MKKITRVGVDLAKTNLYVFGVDSSGKKQLSKYIKRSQFAKFLFDTEPCEMVFEACPTAHYWARKANAAGHHAKLITPAYVKPYVKTNKSDEKDAEAICEAASRPSMRFVTVKSVEQLDLQAQHRVRERLMAQRIALCNQSRALLAEYGIVAPHGVAKLKESVSLALEDSENELSGISRELIAELMLELAAIEDRIKKISNRIQVTADSTECCQLLMTIPGVGPLISTALVSCIGEGKEFKQSRGLSAWLGLVPRQYSTGGKIKLIGISKRGNNYLRKILIQGAHAMLLRAPHKEDSLSRWAMRLKKEKGRQLAAVAVANKLARLMWAVLKNGVAYQPKPVFS